MIYKVELKPKFKDVILPIGFVVLAYIFIKFGIEYFHLKNPEYYMIGAVALMMLFSIALSFKSRRELEILNNNIVIKDKNSTPQNIPKQMIKAIRIGKIASKGNKVNVYFDLVDNSTISLMIRKKT